jgi:hypothetical protein
MGDVFVTIEIPITQQNAGKNTNHFLKFGYLLTHQETRMHRILGIQILIRSPWAYSIEITQLNRKIYTMADM